MTKRTKRILFFASVFLFIVMSFFVVMYAQGYKYDFDAGRFVSTGAISLKANTDTKIFLDDEFISNTSFFGNTGSIDGLLPGQYKVSLLREGYSSWQKSVAVEEGRVTDFPNIIIFPLQGEDKIKLELEIEEIFTQKNLALVTPTPSVTPRPKTKPTPPPAGGPSPDPATTEDRVILYKGRLLENVDNREFVELAAGVKDFVLSENSNKVAWWNNNEIWVAWLNKTSYQPFHEKGDKELITRFSSSIVDVAWFRGEDHLLIKFGQSRAVYKAVEIDKRGGLNIIDL